MEPWSVQTRPKCPYSPITMPLFPVLWVHISRYLVSYRSHEEWKIIQRECFGTLANLGSGQYTVYLPEIAVHKTTDKTNKTKVLAITNITDTANFDRLSLFAYLSQCSIFWYISHRITRPTGRGQNFTSGTPSKIRAKESFACQWREL